MNSKSAIYTRQYKSPHAERQAALYQEKIGLGFSRVDLKYAWRRSRNTLTKWTRWAEEERKDFRKALLDLEMAWIRAGKVGTPPICGYPLFVLGKVNTFQGRRGKSKVKSQEKVREHIRSLPSYEDWKKENGYS